MDDQKKAVYLITSIAALSGLLFGFDTGVIAGAILFVQKTFTMSTLTVELVVSAVLLGAFSGAICSGKCADQFGRRRMIFIAVLAFIIGTLISSLAPNVSVLIAGRFLIGVAIGIVSYTAPLYIAELAPAQNRGAFVIVNNLAIACGQVVAYIVDYAFMAHDSWRWMFGVGVVPAIVLGLGLLLLPESPRWMVQQGKLDKARQILSRIRSKNSINKELDDIIQTVNKKRGTWSDLLDPKIRSVLLIGIGLAVAQQVTGINTILYYAPSIFMHAGYHDLHSQMLATLGMGLMNFFSTILAMWLVDKVGRRRLLLIGTSIMSISLFSVGMAFNMAEPNEVLRWISVLGLLTFIGSYAISLGCLFWLMISEIYPCHIRGLAMSVATAANWGSNLIVAMTFLSILEVYGPADTFWLYATLSIASWVFCYHFVPETKGRSLEEIENSLNLEKGLWSVGKVFGKSVVEPSSATIN